MGPPSLSEGDDDGLLAAERRSVGLFKKTALMVVGVALQTYGTAIGEQQEVLMHAADILMDVYASESAVLRAAAANASNRPRAALQVDAARVFVNDAAMRIDASARQALAAMAEGDALRTMLSALRRLSKSTPINTAALRRGIADATVDKGAYPFA
jgi:alkylation response protein AidB-like acyl-CoA dehydrogenase